MNHDSSFYRRPKKTVVQLTSLLDLLFVMIFVSLMQQKAPQAVKEEMKKKEITTPVTQKSTQQTKFLVEAEFHFYRTQSNPNIPDGKYLMQGTYDKQTGALKLGGVGWIEKPQHYDMVPLSGKIGPSEKTFTGRIEFQSCQEFTLRRTSSQGSSPISGKWEGSYQCAQGSTGLTLSIL